MGRKVVKYWDKGTYIRPYKYIDNDKGIKFTLLRVLVSVNHLKTVFILASTRRIYH